MVIRRRPEQWPPNRPLTFKPPNEGRLTSLREFDVDGGDTIVAVFQGSRGANPYLDIIIKYRQRGKRLRTPKHLHWAIDLLIKKQHREALTNEFVEFLIALYDQLQPFGSQADRANRLENQIGGAFNGKLLERFQPLNEFGEYSVEFTGYILELMGICEKTSDPNAFMFRRVLLSVLDGRDIFGIVSAAGYSGR